MKILHLSSESSWRGGEQQIAYLIEELDKMGIEPIIACKPDSAFEKHCTEKEWNYHPIQMRNSGDVLSGLRLKQLCKEQGIDIVHAHSSHSHSTAFLSFLFGNQTPVVLTRRVDFALKNDFISRYKYRFPKLKQIVCVSDAIREIVIEGTGNSDNCKTIYSAINHQKFEPYIGGNFLRETYNLPNDLTLIGNTSALAPHKDYFTFVDTATRYIHSFDRDVRFFIIGEGEDETAIRAHVKQAQLDDYFIFTGFLSNIEEVLPSLDLFFMSSKTEGLGTSVIDAFAAKVPVVATQAGGIPELVQHTQTGLSSAIGDSIGLADNLYALKQNPELRERVISNAYDYSLQFNTKTMAINYRAVYDEIISGS